MSSYCELAPGHPVHRPYHDREYGFPLEDESALFERLSLEIFQAGLSWLVVLRKRPAIAAAFSSFDVDRVAAFSDVDLARLLADQGIIRNRTKIAAIVENARRLVALRPTFGGFHGWLEHYHPQSLAAWLAAFRAAFRFMGTEVVREFLVSTGYLPGAHRDSCPIYHEVLKQRPRWCDAKLGPASS